MGLNDIEALFIGGPLDGKIQTVPNRSIHAAHMLEPSPVEISAISPGVPEVVYHQYRIIVVDADGEQKMVHLFKPEIDGPPTDLEMNKARIELGNGSIKLGQPPHWHTSHGVLAGVDKGGKEWIGFPPPGAYKPPPFKKTPNYIAAKKPLNKTTVVERRAKVDKMFAKGSTRATIAAALGVSIYTISKDLHALGLVNTGAMAQAAKDAKEKAAKKAAKGSWIQKKKTVPPPPPVVQPPPLPKPPPSMRPKGVKRIVPPGTRRMRGGS